MVRCNRCGTILVYEFKIRSMIGAITNGTNIYPDVSWVLGNIKETGMRIDVRNLYCIECDRHPEKMYIECYSCGEKFVFSSNKEFKDIVGDKTFVNRFICRSCLGESTNDDEAPF